MDKSLGNIELKKNRWFKIFTPDKDYCPNILRIPLIQGMNIFVQIRYEGAFELRNQPFLDERLLVDFPQTYPITNCVLARENLIPSDDQNNSFISQYPTSKTIELPPLDFVRANIPRDIRRKHIHTVKKGKRIARKIYQEGNDLESLLMNLYGFVEDSMSLEECYFLQESLPYLIDEYNKTGKFPGTCKAVSTFVTGLANALGLASRRVGGPIISDKPIGTYGKDKTKLTDSIIGHSWSEIYIPINSKEGFWIPLDPGAGAFKTYPSRNESYHLNVGLPKFKGEKEARLKVSYVKAQPN